MEIDGNKEKEEAVSLNIAILPDEKTSEQAIEWSQSLAEKLPTTYVLNPDSLLPHITVYQAHYPIVNINKLKDVLKKLAEETDRLKIDMGDLKVSHGTFVFWNCIKTKTLYDLQARTIRLADPLRNSLIMPQLKDRTNLSPGDEYDIKTYGSLLIGERYKPHFTLTRLVNPEDADKVKEIIGEGKRVTFVPSSLVLGHLGADGTITGIIERVPLG